MTDREKILQRIKHLMNHSKSAKEFGSLVEAESFMTKAIDLMNQYNFSLYDVESAKDRTEEDEFKNWGYGEDIPYSDKHLGDAWKFQLMQTITSYNYTSFSFRRHAKTLRVYGRMENVEMSVWLYHFASTGLYNLAIDHYNVERKAGRVDARTGAYAYKRDFLLGAIKGLTEKFYEERQKNANTLAVVKVNSAALSKFFYKQNPTARPAAGPGSKPIKVGHGYNQGFDAGKNFNFNKPLASGGSSKTVKKLN